MRRIFCAFLLGLTLLPLGAFGGKETIYVNKEKGCMYFRPSSVGAHKRRFWFCGAEEKCGDFDPDDYDPVITPNLIDKNPRGIANYYLPGSDHVRVSILCCPDGTMQVKTNEEYMANGGDKGWVDYFHLTTRKKNLPDGGMCNVSYYKECGENSVEIDCSEPDSCSDGLVLRNGQCVEPCAAGYGFQSETSSKCVECKTGKLQGVNNDDKICKHCNPGSEFWSPSKQECISRNLFSKYSSGKMNDCWKCPANDFDICVTTDNIDALDSEVRRRCRLN